MCQEDLSHSVMDWAAVEAQVTEPWCPERQRKSTAADWVSDMPRLGNREPRGFWNSLPVCQTPLDWLYRAMCPKGQ